MTLTVLQDRDCRFCTKTAELLAKLDWLHHLRLPGIDGDVRLAGGRLLSREEQLEQVHVIDEHGVAERGFFAFRRIALELPALWPLVPLLYLPGAGLVGQPAYRWVSEHRDLLVKLLRLG